MTKRMFVILIGIISLMLFLMIPEILTGMSIFDAYLSSRGLNLSITIDGTPPYVEIIVPRNMSYPVEDVLLNYNVTDALTPISTIWYHLDGGTNTTITAPTTIHAPAGSHILFLYANDSAGNVNYSSVAFTTTAPPPVLPPGGGGGGTREVVCIEQWVCKDWTPCLFNYQTRFCRDLEHCNTNSSKPETGRVCYVPSCSDGIKNQEETGIDCGGPCPPCKTCSDDVKNCHDGLCEEEVDCGGPCLPCGLVAITEVEFLTTPWLTLGLILIIILIIEVYLYTKKQKLRAKQLPFSEKKMKEAAKKLMQYFSIKKSKKK